jgi:hypothetical protein
VNVQPLKNALASFIPSSFSYNCPSEAMRIRNDESVFGGGWTEFAASMASVWLDSQELKHGFRPAWKMW